MYARAIHLYPISKKMKAFVLLAFIQVWLCSTDRTDAFQQHFWRLQSGDQCSFLHYPCQEKKQSGLSDSCCLVNAPKNTVLPTKPRYRWSLRDSRQTSHDDIEDVTIAEGYEDDGHDGDGDEDATFFNSKEEENFFDEAEKDANRRNFPIGKPEGYYVTKQYSIPSEGFESLSYRSNSDGVDVAMSITEEEIDRLKITPMNMTLPIAIMLLDGETYPSLSRARKACRKGHIVVNRGPLIRNVDTGKYEFDQRTCFKGRVIDRVYPGVEEIFLKTKDVVGIQSRLRGGYYPGFDTSKPSFELPVVYEDSHFAIVNKPAGIVCYSQRDGNHGVMTIRHALPFVLKPPKRGTSGIYLRPVGVHRLDKPTSGLLVVSKTKPALVHLSKQFEERRAKKTYTAIVNGIPTEPKETSITTSEAIELGIDVGECRDEDVRWQIIDSPLDEKSAVTIWRPVRYAKSLKANEGSLTVVELKPKTGRYHQLRRHMSSMCGCPLVGDVAYDGGNDDAISLRGRGLFLCSNEIRLEHPYYNTVEGRAEWEGLSDNEKSAGGKLVLSEDGATIEVHVKIDLPNKFQSFLATEEKRFGKLGQDTKIV